MYHGACVPYQCILDYLFKCDNNFNLPSKNKEDNEKGSQAEN